MVCSVLFPAPHTLSFLIFKHVRTYNLQLISPIFPTHLSGNDPSQMPLQSLVNHELDGGVGHQQQGRKGAAPQRCHALLRGDLPDCVCKTSKSHNETC